MMKFNFLCKLQARVPIALKMLQKLSIALKMLQKLSLNGPFLKSRLSLRG